MEIAFDAPTFGVGSLNDSNPRFTYLRELSLELRAQSLVVDRESSRRSHSAHQPRILEQ